MTYTQKHWQLPNGSKEKDFFPFTEFSFAQFLWVSFTQFIQTDILPEKNEEEEFQLFIHYNITLG